MLWRTVGEHCERTFKFFSTLNMFIIKVHMILLCDLGPYKLLARSGNSAWTTAYDCHMMTSNFVKLCFAN